MLATQHLTKGQGAPPKGSKEQSKHRSHRGEERNYIGTVPLLDMHETFAKYIWLKIWLKMPGVKEEL
jgi:hypothetical protein